MGSRAAVLGAGLAPQVHSRSARSLLLGERFAFFSVVAVLCCAVSATGHLDSSAVTGLAIAAIAIAMWHGAYDQVQGEQVLSRFFGRQWLAVFLGGYVALAALTLLGWWLFPLASLVMFLGYSAWHFGTEPEQQTPGLLTALAATALGAVPIVAACRWHTAAVVPIFAQLLHGALAPAMDASTLARLLSIACWPVLGLAFLAMATGQFGRGTMQRVQLLVVTSLQVALFIFCDPILAFAVYFCGWHTPEHLVTTSVPERDGETLGGNLFHNLRVGFVPWLLSLAFLAGAFYLGHQKAASYRAEIFVVLSALTVPHMALNELRRAADRRTAEGVKESFA